MQDTVKNDGPVTARWVGTLLVVSLGLNLAVLAMVAGLLLRPEGGPGRGAADPGLGAFGAPYMRALPREDRRAVLGALRADRGATLPDRGMRREMFREVLVHLRASPFDAAALEAAVTRQADVSVAVQRRAQRAWLQQVAAMAPEQRQAYADAVEALLKRGPRPR